MPTSSARTSNAEAGVADQKIPEGAAGPTGGFGQEMLLDPALSAIERLYVALLGIPVIGLRIRSRRILPVLDSLRSRPLRKIGDAGCGRGLFSFYLARAFPKAEIVGMDLDRERIERNSAIARRAGIRNSRFVVQDVTAIEPGAGYDLLLSMDNLEHLEDDVGQLRVFHQALAPGGSLLIHTPHVTRNLFGLRRTNLMIPGHVRPGYTLPGICRMLEEAGFEVERSGYTHGYFETLSTQLAYLITGGEERRKALYAMCFPFLLALSQLGRFVEPREGSAIMVLARKPGAH